MTKEIKTRTPAFHEGHADFYSGRLTNRYRPNSQYSKEWTHGFDVAYFENLANNIKNGI